MLLIAAGESKSPLWRVLMAESDVAEAARAELERRRAASGE